MKDEYIPFGFSVVKSLDEMTAEEIDAMNEEVLAEERLADAWDRTVGDHPYEILYARRRFLVTKEGILLTERDLFELDLSVTEVTEMETREAWESSYNPQDGWGMKPIGVNYDYVDEKSSACPEHWLVWLKTGLCPEAPFCSHRKGK